MALEPPFEREEQDVWLDVPDPNHPGIPLCRIHVRISFLAYASGTRGFLRTLGGCLAPWWLACRRKALFVMLWTRTRDLTLSRCVPPITWGDVTRLECARGGLLAADMRRRNCHFRSTFRDQRIAGKNLLRLTDKVVSFLPSTSFCFPSFLSLSLVF